MVDNTLEKLNYLKRTDGVLNTIQYYTILSKNDRHSFSIDEAQRRISNWQSEADYLDLSSLNLTELPHNLPVRLKYLDCNYNNITRLPDNLPPNLIDIYCNHTLLKILPDTLPATLLMLSCNNTQITFLPNTLPAGLREIYCNDTPLDSLPDILPTSLASGLLCYNTNIPFRKDVSHG